MSNPKLLRYWFTPPWHSFKILVAVYATMIVLSLVLFITAYIYHLYQQLPASESVLSQEARNPCVTAKLSQVQLPASITRGDVIEARDFCTAQAKLALQKIFYWNRGCKRGWCFNSTEGFNTKLRRDFVAPLLVVN